MKEPFQLICAMRGLMVVSIGPEVRILLLHEHRQPFQKILRAGLCYESLSLSFQLCLEHWEQCCIDERLGAAKGSRRSVSQLS